MKFTYNNIEYIIIDGSSADNTLSIIKKFEPQFNGKLRWVSEKDNGLYDAMNKYGIENFIIETLQECEEDVLAEVEIF